MRCCQVCGCASWGPVGNPAELTRLSELMPEATVNQFVRCDNCHSVARSDLLYETPPVAGAFMPQAMVPDAGFGSPLTDLFKPMLASVSAPPTRTERLVVKLLDSFLIDSDTSPRDIVKLARDIETALDVLERKAPQQPWLVLTFTAREEFERWCTGMWDAINEKDGHDFTTTSDYPQSWWDAAVNYVETRHRAV